MGRHRAGRRGRDRNPGRRLPDRRHRHEDAGPPRTVPGAGLPRHIRHRAGVRREADQQNGAGEDVREQRSAAVRRRAGYGQRAGDVGGRGEASFAVAGVSAAAPGGNGGEGMICKIQDVREFRPLSLPAPSGWKRAEVRDRVKHMSMTPAAVPAE